MVRKLLGTLLKDQVRPERAFGFLPAMTLVAGLCLVHPLHSLDGFLYTRDLDVPAAGWVRVPLDIDALRHMAPGGADLHVFAPDGSAVPFRLAVTLPESGRRPAQVGRPGKGTLRLDTGADPVPHERVLLDLAEGGARAPVPGLALEGSADGAIWETLASGEPVRLGGAEGLQRIALSYPSTPHRYLRLRWPPGSTLAIAAAEVETVPGPLLTLATQGARCGLSPSSAVCALELPAGQILRRLTLEIEGEGTVGYRLYAPREARWELLARGVWQPTGGEPVRHVLAGPSQAIPGSALRLELYGAGAPRLLGYSLELAVSTVVFHAAGPGRHLLAYGGAGGGAVPRESRGGERAGAFWVEPGPEQEGPVPSLPAGLGAPLDRIRFSNTWAVSTPDAEPGDLVRLELPAAVYGSAREDLGDLRLAQGDRQIPFFRWSPPAPVFAGGDPELQPAGSDRPGESRVLVSLPSDGLPLSQLHLTAAAMPLRRGVTVLYIDPDRRSPRSGRAVREAVGRSIWECAPDPPLPCRAELPLAGPAPRLLTVRLRDGDNPRLPSVGVSVWRRRDVLLFVWPGGGEGGGVRLLAGAADLEAPRYELASLGPALLAHPWRTAEIRSGGAEPEKPWWNRWVMPLGVTIVAAWLVWLLRRILSEA